MHASCIHTHRAAKDKLLTHQSNSAHNLNPAHHLNSRAAKDKQRTDPSAHELTPLLIIVACACVCVVCVCACVCVRVCACAYF